MSAIVKDFWTKPADLPLSTKEFLFGYIDSKGKKYEYEASIKDGDIKSFHGFIFAVLKSKEKKLLPWVPAKNIKDKVNIINTKDDAVQTELALKVAHNFTSQPLISII